MNNKNLKPFEKGDGRAKEAQKKSVEARKENRKISSAYIVFLNKTFNIKTEDGKQNKITGADYIVEIAKSVLSRRDSSSVAMIKEIREATEGSKVNLSGTVKTEMETTEERLKLFEVLVGNEPV